MDCSKNYRQLLSFLTQPLPLSYLTLAALPAVTLHHPSNLHNKTLFHINFPTASCSQPSLPAPKLQPCEKLPLTNPQFPVHPMVGKFQSNCDSSCSKIVVFMAYVRCCFGANITVTRSTIYVAITTIDVD